MKQLAVAILVPTFRRPEGLRRLIASLDRLEFTAVAGPRLSIVVVDNDAEAAQPELVLASHHPLRRVIEPARGLANVRNRALAEAPADADFYAFIDDDEWAEPQWLDAALAMQAETGAAIVQGPVLPSFTRPAAAWMERGGYYEVGPFAPGQRLDFGASGNCLIDAHRLRASGVLFDGAYNVTGGEDADFFERLLARGWAIVAAPQARVFEQVPAERMRLGWLLRLRLRKGNTLGRLAMKSGSRWTKFRRVVKGLAWIGQGLGRFAIAPFRQDGTANNGLADIAFGAGMLSAYLGVQWDFYARGPASEPSPGNRR